MSEYYKNCAFPKAQTKKKNKKQNGWKDKPNRCCHYTGQPYAQRHELFYGDPLRQICIDCGFQVDVCLPIHQLFHGIVGKAALKELNVPSMFPEPLKWAERELERLRQECQRRQEERDRFELGLTHEQARAAWMALIGRNYLD